MVVRFRDSHHITLCSFPLLPSLSLLSSRMRVKSTAGGVDTSYSVLVPTMCQDRRQSLVKGGLYVGVCARSARDF